MDAPTPCERFVQAIDLPECCAACGRSRDAHTIQRAGRALRDLLDYALDMTDCGPPGEEWQSEDLQHAIFTAKELADEILGPES